MDDVRTPEKRLILNPLIQLRRISHISHDQEPADVDRDLHQGYHHGDSLESILLPELLEFVLHLLTLQMVPRLLCIHYLLSIVVHFVLEKLDLLLLELLINLPQ